MSTIPLVARPSPADGQASGLAPRTPPECYSLARYDAWGGQMRRREFSVCLAVRRRGRSLRAVRQTGKVSRMGDRCATPKVNFS